MKTRAAGWYCGMCERWFRRGGECRVCGFDLERAKP